MVFSVISVSAGHQFAVNRWNPGYTGQVAKAAGQLAGQCAPGQAAGHPGGPKSADPPTGPAEPGAVVGPGGIFCLFFFSCTTAPAG